MSASRHQEVDEDAANLTFNQDIEDEQCVPLFLSEVEMLLKERMKKQVDQEGEMSEMFRSTLDYCQRFGQFKNTQTAASVRRVITDESLHKFEGAQLANLCPAEVEVAKAYIPSLEGRVDDEHILKIVTELQAYRM